MRGALSARRATMAARTGLEGSCSPRRRPRSPRGLSEAAAVVIVEAMPTPPENPASAIITRTPALPVFLSPGPRNPPRGDR